MEDEGDLVDADLRLKLRDAVNGLDDETVSGIMMYPLHRMGIDPERGIGLAMASVPTLRAFLNDEEFHKAKLAEKLAECGLPAPCGHNPDGGNHPVVGG